RLMAVAAFFKSQAEHARVRGPERLACVDRLWPEPDENAALLRLLLTRHLADLPARRAKHLARLEFLQPEGAVPSGGELTQAGQEFGWPDAPSALFDLGGGKPHRPAAALLKLDPEKPHFAPGALEREGV